VGYSSLSSEVCMSNTVENDFWISQSKVATSDRWVGQIFKNVHVQFSEDVTYQKSLKSVNFWQVYSKNKKVDVFRNTM